MARVVQCVKLGREAEGLDRLPYPNSGCVFLDKRL